MGFKALQGDTVTLRANGIYKEVGLFSNNGALFAAYAGGYVRLRKDGTTTRDKVMIENMEFEGILYADRHGRLAIEEKPGYTTLTLALPTDDTPLQLTKAPE